MKSSIEDSSFKYSDSFIRAGPRKRRKNKVQHNSPSAPVLLQRVTKELVSDSWITECQQILRGTLSALAFKSPEVLCLGLGSPGLSRDACAQLGFLLNICECFEIDCSKVSVYDPAFTDEDVKLLEELKFRRLAENRHAKHPVEVPTIVFMPHCDMNLYENILQENWTRERLANILFISNRFSEYIDSNPVNKLETGFPCLLRVAPFLDSQPLPISRAYPTAFNNISVQFILSEAISSLHDLGCREHQIPKCEGKEP